VGNAERGGVSNPNLLLYQRLNRSSTGFIDNYAGVARDWERTVLAVGGYGLGSFSLSEEDLTLAELEDFYDNRLECRLAEDTCGITSYEGLLYEFRLVKGGREYRRTLNPKWWRNKVKVVYTYPTADDSQIGNLKYNPAANSFQDDGQDFSEWETAEGDAAYSISVTNSDDTRAWGFLGASFTTTNANDSIYVFTDVERATAGWNGEVSGKTPSTYEVSNVQLAGERQDTGWTENTDSSAEYGRMEYVHTLGGTAPESAEAMRDRDLAEYAWPRSRKVGGGTSEPTGTRGPATLEVSVAGYWVTLNWRYLATSRIATASDMITYLIGLSEWVTAGKVDTNDMRVKADCSPIPARIGDLFEEVILQGDLSQNVWEGGVYAGRKFRYEAAPTAVAYYERDDGVLLDAGRVEVVPSLMGAGVLLLDESAPVGGQPPGTSSAWDDPRVGYVEEVTFKAPNVLEYRLRDEEASLAVLMQQLKAARR
jgi:hypothetical protein